MRTTISLFALVLSAHMALAASISGVWANDGGDKVTQDELRVYRHTQNLTGNTINRVWNGSKITVSGARNEVVGFQVILESATSKTTNASVQFKTLTGPNSAKITTTGTDPQTWTGRPIEVFYERYLQIQGLSFFGYQTENSQIPVRFRANSGLWTDRPDHDKNYPDPLVPTEKVPTFNIDSGKNQGIWIDIFIPKTTSPGLYKGSIKVYESGVLSKQVPVELQVFPFSLPDIPTSKTMLFLDNADIIARYGGGFGHYIQWDSPDGRKGQLAMDKAYQFLHRHKLSAIGENECPFADQPCASSFARLDGSLYQPTAGYDGPGVGTPNGVYSRGTYGTWGNAVYGVDEWRGDQGRFLQHMNAFGSWMHQNLPTTETFLYLADEPTDVQWPDLEKWSTWLAGSTGGAQYVKSFSTLSAIHAMEPSPLPNIPHLLIPTTVAGVGNCQARQSSCDASALMEAAAIKYRQTPYRFWMYNDGHPGVGTLMTEADGVDPRTIPIAQYKKGIDRWFYWEANIARDMDMFATATSWDDRNGYDAMRGKFSGTASNGNGLLIYPGTDVSHTINSYGLNVPIASIRLKNWRWGVQLVDYLAMADKVDHAATVAIVNTLMPKALWENKVQDPSWPITPMSWSSDPSAFESARLQLAQIIQGATPTPDPTPVPVPVPIPTPTPVPTPTPTPVPPANSATAPDVALNSWVVLVAKSSGKCIESVQGMTVGGAFQQNTCINSGQQKLQFVPVQGGYRINSLHSGLQFDMNGGPSALADGQKLIQYPYWGGTNEIFWLDKTEDGYFRIHPRHSGTCLDVAARSLDDGAPIQQWTCYGGENQKFSFVPTS